jgi:hypothetical protein
MSVLELERPAQRADAEGSGGEGSLSLAWIVALGEGMEPLVTLLPEAAGEAVAARTITPLGPGDIGRQVVVWRPGPLLAPIVMGRILGEADRPSAARAGSVTIDTDGERILLTAAKTISLRCGKASVTLSSDGSVVIEGARITSRASGMNRLTGASVHIN